jgi:hypothetical protein
VTPFAGGRGDLVNPAKAWIGWGPAPLKHSVRQQPSFPDSDELLL